MAAVSDESKAYVLALVAFYLRHDRNSWSWVRAYKREPNYKTAPQPQLRQRSDWVGGHWRLRALHKRGLAALACTCKMERLHVAEFPYL